MKLRDLVTDPCAMLDVAHFQGASIPWQQCRDLGIRAAVIKWWHGPWRNQPSVAQQQYREAKAAGLLVGRYAWWVPNASVDAQITAWLSDPWPDDDLPLAIDMEDPALPKGPATLAAAVRIVEVLEQATDRKPIIYSGAWWADAWLGTASPELARCPYWHAAYPRKAARGVDYAGAVQEWLAQDAPKLPAIWAAERPVAWQLDGTDDATGTGALRLPNGVDTDCNLADWAALTALVPAYHRDTDPAPYDARFDDRATRLGEVPSLEQVLQELTEPPPDSTKPTNPGTPSSISTSSLRAVRPEEEPPP